MTLVVDLTTKQAREVTDDIRTLGENLIEKVTVAYRGRVWLALNYKSWDEWKTGELAGVELPRDVIPALRAEGLSQRAIATVTGTSDATVRRDLSTAPSDAVPDRITGLDGKERPATRPEPKNAALYTSDSEDWWTPQDILDRVHGTFGGVIDLDPCSNLGEPNVPALAHFTIADDGLAQDWAGKVYMNPPYGDVLPKWIEKLVDEYVHGDVDEAIALVPSRTDTRWFRLLRPYLRCFIWGRLKFSDNGNSAPFPSMAVYLGRNDRKFIDAFSLIGDVYGRVE